jgi:Uma2 family endonuclease
MSTSVAFPQHSVAPQVNGSSDSAVDWQVATLFPRRGEWTEADYLQLPDRPGVELSNGSLEYLPVPTEKHQLTTKALFGELDRFVVEHGLGEVLFSGQRVRAWEGEIREPDVVFIRETHFGRCTDSFWEGADLVMEVVSDGGESRDRIVKRQVYAQAGIPEYWIVDPIAETVQILTLSGDEYVLHSDLRRGAIAESPTLPGFTLSVDALFNVGRGKPYRR